MTIDELTHDQIVQLKQRYMQKLDDEGTLNEVLYGAPDDGHGLSWGELARADELVPDDVVRREYDGVCFSEDDFN